MAIIVCVVVLFFTKEYCINHFNVKLIKLTTTKGLLFLAVVVWLEICNNRREEIGIFHVDFYYRRY